MAKLVTLIVASAENRAIGLGGRLAFQIPEDQRWFHEKTVGATCVLGRAGFQDWSAATSDGRVPVVVTSVPSVVKSRPGALAARSVSEALDIARTLPGEIMVCGGQRIYEETLPIADRLILTLVHAEVPGDTWFPEWRHFDWQESYRRESSDANYRYTFLILDRARGRL